MTNNLDDKPQGEQTDFYADLSDEQLLELLKDKDKAKPFQWWQARSRRAVDMFMNAGKKNCLLSCPTGDWVQPSPSCGFEHDCIYIIKPEYKLNIE